jgi:hypothetical protein
MEGRVKGDGYCCCILRARAYSPLLFRPPTTPGPTPPPPASASASVSTHLPRWVARGGWPGGRSAACGWSLRALGDCRPPRRCRRTPLTLPPQWQPRPVPPTLRQTRALGCRRLPSRRRPPSPTPRPTLTTPGRRPRPLPRKTAADRSSVPRPYAGGPTSQTTARPASAPPSPGACSS